MYSSVNTKYECFAKVTVLNFFCTVQLCAWFKGGLIPKGIFSLVSSLSKNMLNQDHKLIIRISASDKDLPVSIVISHIFLRIVPKRKYLPILGHLYIYCSQSYYYIRRFKKNVTFIRVSTIKGQSIPEFLLLFGN